MEGSVPASSTADPAPVRFARPRRLHPRSLVQRVLKSLPPLALALAPLVMRGSDVNTWVMLGFLMLYAVFALPLIVLQYLRFRYWITPAEIVIHSGVLTRRKRSIPLERIQNIIIERSLLPRLLGTSKLKIETAGGTGTEGVLEYVSLDEARDIQQLVRTYQQRRPDASEALPAAAPAAEKTAAPTGEEIFAMPFSRLLLSGTFRFSLVYIALIFSGLQYVLDLFNLTPEEITDWLLRGGLRPYAQVAETSPWLWGVATVVLAVLLGWVTGVLITLTKYYGFRLWLEGDKLHRRHGLLTLSEGTIPLKRVQSLILRSNPLMRRFGWYRLELQTMGYEVDQQGYQIAAPFARREDILKLAARIRPFTLPESLTPVSKITIRRTFVRYSLALLVPLLPLAYFFPEALWGLLALPVLLYLAVLQYRNHGYAFADGILYVRRGVLQQYVWVVPVDRFQVFYGMGTYFQRRLGLRSLVIDTAGAGTFRYPEIVDVEAETGEAFLGLLYDRFQARFRTTA